VGHAHFQEGAVSKYRAIEIYRTNGHPKIALILMDAGGRSGTQLCGATPVGDPVESVCINVDKLAALLGEGE